ncbi:MAG: hypothetical protein KY456_15685, partial [Chloroflexi bacterium]|nr:hypothetical protein [Chloroflexota bacterium]
MERDPFTVRHRDFARKRTRRRVIQDAAIVAGSLGAAPWLLRPRSTAAQDLATPIAVPGSGGEIGRPESVPIDNLIVIFLENRPFDHLYGLFLGANGLLSPAAR